MKLIIALIAGVLAVLAGPWIFDSWEAEAALQRIEHSELAYRRRVEPLLAKAAPTEAPDLSTALGLGRPLSQTLFQLSDLAARGGLAMRTLKVDLPVPVHPEGRAAWIAEHRVRVAVTGPADTVQRFVQILPDLEAPLRVEGARLTRPQAPAIAYLELDLVILVPAN